MTPVLVSAEWLLDNIDRVRVLDASSHLPTVKRDAGAEFLAAHIIGAQRFDIDAIADHAAYGPLAQLLRRMRRLAWHQR